MINVIKQIIRRAFNIIGLDVVRLHRLPMNSLLGLKYLPIKTIIDVGANTGQFAKMIRKIFPEAKIYCFEPLPEPFKDLDIWAKREGNGKIKTFNVALGDNDGTVEMFSHIEHSSSSSVLKTTDTCHQLYPFTQKQITTSVKLTTLDNWVKNIPDSLLPEILIKLDVQGYEDRVIKGGKNTFNKATACILEICLDELYEGQANFNEIINLLYDMGFKYAGNLEQTYADDGHVIYIDAVFVN